MHMGNVQVVYQVTQFISSKKKWRNQWRPLLATFQSICPSTNLIRDDTTTGLKRHTYGEGSSQPLLKKLLEALVIKLIRLGFKDYPKDKQKTMSHHQLYVFCVSHLPIAADSEGQQRARSRDCWPQTVGWTDAPVLVVDSPTTTGTQSSQAETVWLYGKEQFVKVVV